VKGPARGVHHPDARILIFAKTPVAGEVKTRLIPALGKAGAAALYRRMLEGVFDRLGHSRLAPLECWCSPDVHHPFFQQAAVRYGLSLKRQRGADLGARMYHAAVSALREVERVVLIGGDAPALDDGHIGQALAWLAEGQDAVLGPAEDGGYVLLGLRRCQPRLFDGIAWGTDQVLALTRTRLAALRWSWAELPELWDVDRPRDLARLKASGLANTL